MFVFYLNNIWKSEIADSIFTSSKEKHTKTLQMKITASQIEVGMKIKQSKMIFVVVRIDSVTDKAITYRMNRIFPDFYEAEFFQRKSLKTLVEIIENQPA